MVRRVVVAIGCLTLLAVVAGAGAAQRRAARGSHWVIRNLGTLPTPYSRDSYAVAINNRGQIVGASNVGRISRQRAVLWTIRR